VTNALRKTANIDLAPLAGAVAIACVLLAGCATAPTDPAERAAFEANNDPLEPMNRDIFAFNLAADKYVIRPVAEGYREVVPGFARDGIRHFLNNLNEPIIFMNNMLQGEAGRAANTVGRFVVNSTVGVGGIVDVMAMDGVPQESGDFGQTMFSYGVGAGPYLVLPILGPSNPRDAFGKLVVDSTADPFNNLINGTIYNEPTLQYVRAGVDGIDLRARNIETLDQLQRDSLDFYAKMRSVTRQYRDSELRHGKPAEPDPSLYGSGPEPTNLLP
jgi:phospholipid-binding lipoprotein MlaA